MSICVALAVPDGIALAADTQTTWQRAITQVEAKDGKTVDLAQPIQVPIGWSRMARKLFQMSFGEFQYAVCTAGVVSINRKTTFSIMKSAEATYSGDGQYDDVIEHCRNTVWNELKEEFQADDLAKALARLLELIIGGFRDEDVSKSILEVHYIYSGTITTDGKPNPSGYAQGWKNSDRGDFGCCWIGQKAFVNHVVNHGNNKLPPIQGYDMMTLEDAKDYARFLVEYTCDFQRFAVMVPDCGRPVVVASLTPDEYVEKII